MHEMGVKSEGVPPYGSAARSLDMHTQTHKKNKVCVGGMAARGGLPWLHLGSRGLPRYTRTQDTSPDSVCPLQQRQNHTPAIQLAPQ